MSSIGDWTIDALITRNGVEVGRMSFFAVQGVPERGDTLNVDGQLYLVHNRTWIANTTYWRHCSADMDDYPLPTRKIQLEVMPAAIVQMSQEVKLRMNDGTEST